MTEQGAQHPVSTAFVSLLTQHQSRLYRFILSLTADRELAEDVLQETNVVLCQKADQFELGTNFLAWSFAIARYQVLSTRLKLGRDRHVFNDDLVNELAEGESLVDDDRRKIALKQCMEQLPGHQREVVGARYEQGRGVNQIAEQLGKTANAVSALLHRVRLSLMRCVQQRLAQEDAS